MNVELTVLHLPVAPRETGSMRRKPKGVIPMVASTTSGRGIYPATKKVLDACKVPLIGNARVSSVSLRNIPSCFFVKICSVVTVQTKCESNLSDMM